MLQKNTLVERLDLTDNKIGSEGAVYIANMLKTNEFITDLVILLAFHIGVIYKTVLVNQKVTIFCARFFKRERRTPWMKRYILILSCMLEHNCSYVTVSYFALK